MVASLVGFNLCGSHVARTQSHLQRLQHKYTVKLLRPKFRELARGIGSESVGPPEAS